MPDDRREDCMFEGPEVVKTSYWSESVVNASMADRDRLADVIDRAWDVLTLSTSTDIMGSVAELHKLINEATDILSEGLPEDPETGGRMGVGDGR